MNLLTSIQNFILSKGLVILDIIPDNTQDDDINNALADVAFVITNIIIPVAMFIALCVFVFIGIKEGIKMANARSEEEKTNSKKNLIWLVIGMGVTAMSIWLVPLIFNLLRGVNGIGS